MNEKKLRAKWEKAVSTDNKEFLDEAWREMDEDGLVVFALDEPETGVKDLVAIAESRLRYWRLGQKRPKPPGRQKLENEKEYVPRLGPREYERAGAFEEHLAKVATIDQSVYRFREKVLGGPLLVPEQARALLTSEAARFFSLALFRKWNIPLIGHAAELVEYKTKREGAEVWNYATVSVEPPGITKTVPALSVEPHSDLLTVWSGRDRNKRIRELTFPGEDGYVKGVFVWKRSVLGELHKLTQKLTKRYPWQDAQATWFVLTGTIPAAPPLKIRYRVNRGTNVTNGAITLEAAPWVPAKIVYRAFRGAQRRVLVGDNQPISEKNLKLFRFVTERIDPVGLLKERHTDVPDSDWMTTEELVANLRYAKVPKGSELVEEWDKQEWVQEEPKKRAYDKDTRRFWRDYHRARRAVAHAFYRRPNEL